MVTPLLGKFVLDLYLFYDSCRKNFPAKKILTKNPRIFIIILKTFYYSVAAICGTSAKFSEVIIKIVDDSEDNGANIGCDFQNFGLI